MHFNKTFNIIFVQIKIETNFIYPLNMHKQQVDLNSTYVQVYS